MTSMRRHYVASTSLRRHVPAGNLAPPLGSPNILNLGPPNILNLPTPMEPRRYDQAINGYVADEFISPIKVFVSMVSDYVRKYPKIILFKIILYEY